MTDQTEKTKSQRAAEAGREFLLEEQFKVFNPFISKNIGRMLLAREEVVDGEEHFFGGRLHDDIRDLIQHSEWHTKKVLRVALFALVSEQVWLLRPNYFANLHKTFFGFPIKNPFAESYLAWNHIEQNDSLGETGLGALEGLKAISSTGVFVPTLMFDLCHLLIKLEASSDKAKIPEDSLVFERRKNPGDLLPYKVGNLDAHAPHLAAEGQITELREIYGFKISISCKPERLQWFASSNADAYDVLHLSVDQLKIGSDDAFSYLGPNQFFAIDGESVIVLPDLISIRVKTTGQRKVEGDYLQRLRGVNAKVNQFVEDDGNNFIGDVNLFYSPNLIFDGGKYPAEISFQVGLDESIFESITGEVKKGNVDVIHLDATLLIDSAFTSGSQYDGFSKDVIFYGSHEAVGRVSDFSVEYRFK